MLLNNLNFRFCAEIEFSKLQCPEFSKASRVPWQFDVRHKAIARKRSDDELRSYCNGHSNYASRRRVALKVKQEAGDEGAFDIELEIFEFMQSSGNPNSFPTKRQLIDAGRTDLVRAIQQEGGWLSMGWEKEASETPAASLPSQSLASSKPVTYDEFESPRKAILSANATLSNAAIPLTENALAQKAEDIGSKSNSSDTNDQKMNSKDKDDFLDEFILSESAKQITETKKPESVLLEEAKNYDADKITDSKPKNPWSWKKPKGPPGQQKSDVDFDLERELREISSRKGDSDRMPSFRDIRESKRKHLEEEIKRRGGWKVVADLFGLKGHTIQGVPKAGRQHKFTNQSPEDPGEGVPNNSSVNSNQPLQGSVRQPSNSADWDSNQQRSKGEEQLQRKSRTSKDPQASWPAGQRVSRWRWKKSPAAASSPESKKPAGNASPDMSHQPKAETPSSSSTSSGRNSGSASGDASGSTSSNTSGNPAGNSPGNSSGDTSFNTSDNSSGNTSGYSSGNSSGYTSSNSSDSSSGNPSGSTSGNISSSSSGSSFASADPEANPAIGPSVSASQVGRGTPPYPAAVPETGGSPSVAKSVSVLDRIKALEQSLVSQREALHSSRNSLLSSSVLTAEQEGKQARAETVQSLVDIADSLEFRENTILRTRKEIRRTRAEVVALEGKLAVEFEEARRSLEDRAAMSLLSEKETVRLRQARVVWPNHGFDVMLTGSFDGWANKIKMEMSNAGVFVTKLQLLPGRYEIKFIVDGVWKVDPHRPIVYSGGNENNVLVVF